MEPRAGAAASLTGDETAVSAEVTWRLRLIAACVVLVGLALVQSPGLLVADTKLDLAIAPVDFLSRAAHLWDAEGAFGQLQNQAYGYLWPMGPFFVLGSLVDLPGWVVQRLWLALVMGVALVGAAKVSRALGVRSDLACILAGFAYALSPRMLTTLGPISIEAWPSAMAPWVLLPLVLGATRGSPWRAAALSGLAVAMVGGVNAAATFAVLPLGAVWLLTRTRGARRWRMMVGWPLFTALGTLWWLVPLFVMGAYSPPFLDYIETAASTTFPTDLVDVLRGTSHWVPYVDAASRAGKDLITQPYLALNSALVLGGGLLGLALRRNGERFFLMVGLLTGVLLVSMGHVGAVQGWFAVPVHNLLDGALAPVRNVHKFDPVVRLPLVVGLAWSVQALVERTGRSSSTERVNARVLVAVLVLAVVGASSPAVLGRITPAGGFTAVPDYWVEAANWLEDHQEDGVALLVPGSSFASYAWGRPQDEPLQALADGRWAVRNAVPLTPPGNIRMLDGIEKRLQTGAGSAGFTASLRRAGVTHLVVRNDLSPSPDVVDPVLVHETIATSPGLAPVAAFGPTVGGDAHLTQDGEQRLVINGGWQARYRAIEVYEVEGGAGHAVGADEVIPIVGGPEDLGDLIDLDVIGSAPTVLAADARPGNPGGPDTEGWILTDGNRAVERHFGALHDSVSETLVRGQSLRLDGPVRDYVMAEPDRWSTFAEYDGIADVRASSSASDASAGGNAEPGRMPYAALDGHVETRWASGSTGSQPWWQVDLEAPRTVGQVALTGGAQDQWVVVSIPGWHSDPVRLPAGVTRSVALPAGDAAWLRVTEASGVAGASLTLSEVGVPAVQPRRRLRLPALPEGAAMPDAVVLRAVDDNRTGCATVDGAVRCIPGRQVAAEEPLGFRRVLTLPTPADLPLELRVRARPGPRLDEALQVGDLAVVGASSSGSPDPRAGALAAVDGHVGTTWTAAVEEERPRFTVRWVGPRTVRGIQARVDADTAARAPTTVRVTSDRGTRLVELGPGGRAPFRPLRTTSLTLEVLEAELVHSLDPDGRGMGAPVGIGELRVRGLGGIPGMPSSQVRRWPCGSGPELVVNEQHFRTAVRASALQLYSGAEVPAKLCGREQEVTVRAGENTVDVLASDVVTPVSLVLGRTTTHVATPVPAPLEGPVRRRIVTEGRSVVATSENANPGWQGPGFQPFVADGWKQAWTAGSDRDTLSSFFGPDRLYRAGLAGGGAALLALLLALLLLWTRPGNRRGEPLRAAQPAGLGWLLGVGGAGLLAGTGAALAAAFGGLLVTVLSRRAPAAVPALATVLVVAAASSQAGWPWGSAEGWSGALAWPGYLLVGGLVVALVGASPGSRRAHRGGAARNRIAGISTRR